MKKHIIINIGRQLGSGGREVGKRIAEKLNIAFFDKNLIDLASKESGLSKDCFEKADEKANQGILGSFFSMHYPFVDSGYSNVNYMSNDSLFKIQSDVIKDLASKQSCIFVGRCADYVLRNNPDAVSIFISCPKEERLDRLCQRHGISKEDAGDMSIKTDKGRAQFYNYYSYKTWGAAKTYDLCINSSLFGIDGTADFIIDFIKKRFDIED